MSSKFLKDRMWKVVKVVETIDSIRVFHFKLVETDKKEEALSVVLYNKKKRCPECGSSHCMRSSCVLDAPFEDEDENCMLCICRNNGKQFIFASKSELRSERGCLICGSGFVDFDEFKNSKGKFDFSITTCKHCKQSYFRFSPERIEKMILSYLKKANNADNPSFKKNMPKSFPIFFDILSLYYNKFSYSTYFEGLPMELKRSLIRKTE